MDSSSMTCAQPSATSLPIAVMIHTATARTVRYQIHRMFASVFTSSSISCGRSVSNQMTPTALYVIDLFNQYFF